MDTSLPERLKRLAKNRVFAVAAVIFFAFLTAFILVLLSSQTSDPTLDELRSRLNGGQNGVGGNGNGARTAGTNGQGTGANGARGTSGTTVGQNGQSTNGQQTKVDVVLQQIIKNALPLPKVQATQLDLKTSYPTIPEQVKVYTFRTDYTDAEVLAFAQQVGVKNDYVESKGSVMSIMDLSGNSLTFDRKTGSYYLSSTNGIKPTSTSTSPTIQATNFLKQIGVFDDTMIYTGVYRSPDDSSLQAVEFHRDWNKVGFPIFDLLGIYNLSPDRSLRSVRLAEQDKNEPGARGNYFNSATVEVDSSGKIHSITSTFRRIKNVIVVDKNQLRTPQQALADAQAGRAVYSLSVPSGSGFIDVAKMYPGDTATASNVSITDFIAAYWENNGTAQQQELTPYYLLCGNATLDTGYGNRMCYVVPLLTDNTSSVLGVHTQFLAQNNDPIKNPLPTQVSTSKGDSLQYGTFGFKATESNCPQTFTNSFKIGKGQYIAWVHVPPPGVRKWYWVITNEAGDVPVTTDTGGKLSGQVKSDLVKARAQAWAKCKPRLPDVCGGAPAGSTVVGCYFILTGSPSIHIYPTQTQNVSVSVNPLGGVAYANPIFSSQTDTTWNVIASPDGNITTENSIKTDHLYYEFDRRKVSAALSAKHDTSYGYVILKQDIDQFVASLSQKVGLNTQEEKDLASELKRETATLSAKYLKVSFVEQSLLDEVLPINISPKPQQTYRLMLYIESTSSLYSLPAPRLERVWRNGYTVVETGVNIGD